VSASASVVVPRRTAFADYLELTKPRITLTVVMTALVGYVMGTRGPVNFSRLGVALLGTALVAAGASALNMLLERRTDALMLRTRNRPVASGRLGVPEALVFGLALTLVGLGVLRFGAGPLAALVALVTWASYLFAYTPLKTRTSLSTIVGAFPGALPPVIGWTAARGQIEPGAVVLFAILFLWQIPHFLAIAWIYREDYARGGLPMLPVLDPAGVVTGRQAVANSLALLLVSVVPTIAGLTGRLYFVGAVGLGIAFTAVAVWSAIRRTAAAARGLFLASILYLLALCTLLLADRI
jgi:protoheme IX farnesyltransferase